MRSLLQHDSTVYESEWFLQTTWTEETILQGLYSAAERLEKREVRSFKVDHVNALWHLDFHHGSRRILGQDGQWHKPLLLVIMDDRSGLVCHAQWYMDENVETLVHGFMQAMQKRALPRALWGEVE